MRSTVRPKHSPWRRPVPAARTMRARKRSGAAAINASTSAKERGATRSRSTLGSLSPTHGDEAIRRSATADRNTAERYRAISLTVPAESSSVRALTHD